MIVHLKKIDKLLTKYSFLFYIRIETVFKTFVIKIHLYCTKKKGYNVMSNPYFSPLFLISNKINHSYTSNVHFGCLLNS